MEIEEKWNTPLVSIVVITYNSSKYVLETLESAKTQTYQNIELIVTDDCSSDDTVAVCEKWIKENKERFVRTELITVTKNTGIAPNCNRGVKAAAGEWVKVIAGDDAFLNNAIEEIVIFGCKNPSVEIILTQVEMYNDVFNKNNLISIRPLDWQSIPAYSQNATWEIQLEYILNGGYYNAPGIFSRRKVYEDIRFYEEKYPLIEDVPFYLNVALKGKIMIFVPIITVKYRKHQNNLTSVHKKVIANYTYQYYSAIYNASLKYGKKKYIHNAYWNKSLVFLIFKLGNKGVLLNFLNNKRIALQPIRFFNLLNKMLL